jgi:putative membrane protein
MQILLIFALIVAIIAVVFAVQNADPAPIRFLFWEAQMPQAVTLLTAALLGALVSLLASIPSLGKAKWLIRKQTKQITDLETKVTTQEAEIDESKKRLQELEQKQLEAKKETKPVDAGMESPVTPSKVEGDNAA